MLESVAIGIAFVIGGAFAVIAVGGAIIVIGETIRYLKNL